VNVDGCAELLPRANFLTEECIIFTAIAGHVEPLVERLSPLVDRAAEMDNLCSGVDLSSGVRQAHWRSKTFSLCPAGIGVRLGYNTAAECTVNLRSAHCDLTFRAIGDGREGRYCLCFLFRYVIGNCINLVRDCILEVQPVFGREIRKSVNGTMSDMLRNSNQLPDASVRDFRYSPWLALYCSSKEQWPSGMGSGILQID